MLLNDIKNHSRFKKDAQRYRAAFPSVILYSMSDVRLVGDINGHDVLPETNGIYSYKNIVTFTWYLLLFV